MNVAIIPARGGSKGILRKNLQIVGGTPLLVRTIEQARLSESIHEVIVSTDDDEIADAAVLAGALVHRRPPELGGDTVTSEAVLLDVLKDRDVNLFAFLQCTSPFTKAEEIDACMMMLERKHLDVVFTVERTHSGYWVLDPTGNIRCMNYDVTRPRPPRQTGPVCWRETGGVYAIRASSFVRSKSRFCGDAGVFEVSERSAIEIDNPFDLNIARAVADVYEFQQARVNETARCKSDAPGSPAAWPGGVEPT